MKKRNIITLGLSFLMTISACFVANNQTKTNNKISEVSATNLVGGASITWNNCDFSGFAPNVVDTVPQDGFSLLVQYENDISATTYTDKNLITAGVAGCNVADHILVNGEPCSEITDAFVYCFPTNGFYIYVPRASITLGEEYDYLTIEVLDGLSIDGSVQVEGNSFEYRGPLKTFGNWLKDPEPIIKIDGEFDHIEWDNRDYSPTMSQSWTGELSTDAAPLNGYCILAFFNEPGKTPIESEIGTMVTTGRGVVGNGDPVDHKIKINGVNIAEVTDSKCYIFPQYGLFIYFPDSSLSNKDVYIYPTIAIESGLHFKNVNLPEITFEFKGTLGKGGGWSVKKGASDYNHFPFTVVNPYNNNLPNEAGYHHTILDFGTEDIDYLADNKTANSENQATLAFDIGSKLTINGLPISKIHDKYPKTKVGYDHGKNHLFIVYPNDLLLPTKECPVPTLHIEENTIFMDTMLPETTLYLAGTTWKEGEFETFSVENPFDFNRGLQVRFPHQVGAESHAIFAELPAEGVELEFNVNSGTVTLGTSRVLVLDGFYGFTAQIDFGWHTITLCDQKNSYAGLQTFLNYAFEANTDYLFELKVVCGVKTEVIIAINHLVVIHYEMNNDRTGKCAIWGVDVGDAVLDYKKEYPTYTPSIIYGGMSSYDFNEGDPVYDFTGIARLVSLYDDSSSVITYEYEEGAVTDNKYNAGVWTLTITFELEGYSAITKEITINVHGTVSMAKIYYGDVDPIEVPVGSHLIPPPNPNTYHDDEFDYIFDGWYYEGFKWDFETGVVAGDMHFEVRFKKAPLHYAVTVKYEGIIREDDRFLVAKDGYLPLGVFEFDGTTYEVYLEGEKISSLQVTSDVTIVVKYTITYTYVEPKESTCTEDGNIGYYYSPIFGDYYFADPNGREVLNPDDVILPKSNHNIVHLDAKDSTCVEVGNVDCYYCENCHKHFTDAEGNNELIDWSIPKKEHDLTHHEGKAATCTENGTLEYWTCANEPGVIYGDEACSYTLDEIFIKATGHKYIAPIYEWKAIDGGFECVATITCVNCGDVISETKVATKTIVREASCTQEGQIAYSVAFDNPYFNAQTKIISVAKLAHSYTYVGAVEATKDKDGMKEHYICNDCNKYFVKDGETYMEVSYGELVIRYKNDEPEEKKGCGSSILASSLVLTISACLSAVLVLVRRKEEK